MALPDTTLNTADAVANSSVAADKPVFDPDSIGLVNTVDDGSTAAPAPAGTQDGTSDPTIKPDGDAATAKEADSDGDRFDKHPRWQQIMQERDEARRVADEARQEAQRVREERIRLEAERDFLRQQATPAKPETLPYKDTTAMSAEEIADWMANDPKGYHDNLMIQARELARREAQSLLDQSRTATQRELEQAEIKRRYEAYEKDNPEFKKMWDSGEIVKFMESNPGMYTPISAHKEMTREAREKAIAEAAAKEAEERTNKNWQAKRQATVMGTGPAGVGTTSEADAELNNTKERGGAVSVLVNRLQKMRQAAGR